MARKRGTAKRGQCPTLANGQVNSNGFPYGKENGDRFDNVLPRNTYEPKAYLNDDVRYDSKAPLKYTSHRCTQSNATLKTTMNFSPKFEAEPMDTSGYKSSSGGRRENSLDRNYKSTNHYKLRPVDTSMVQSRDSTPALAPMHPLADCLLPEVDPPSRSLLNFARDVNMEDYEPGGYYPINIFNVLNGRYSVILKLGWGHFSSVWLCLDIRNSKFVAIRVMKASEAEFDAPTGQHPTQRNRFRKMFCNNLKGSETLDVLNLVLKVDVETNRESTLAERVSAASALLAKATLYRESLQAQQCFATNAVAILQDHSHPPPPPSLPPSSPPSLPPSSPQPPNEPPREPQQQLGRNREECWACGLVYPTNLMPIHRRWHLGIIDQQVQCTITRCRHLFTSERSWKVHCKEFHRHYKIPHHRKDRDWLLSPTQTASQIRHYKKRLGERHRRGEHEEGIEDESEDSMDSASE